jgi:hypothetical protein
MPPCLRLLLQRLVQGAVEMAELHEEVTRAQVATMMARACVVQVEGMARERAALLAPPVGRQSKQARGSPLQGMNLQLYARLKTLLK